MRTTYKVKSEEYAYFITSTIVRWIPVFCYRQITEFLIGAINYSKEKKGLQVYAWVIMPEHFHMICKSERLIEVIKSIKSFTAKKILSFLEHTEDDKLLEQFRLNKKSYKESSRYQVWQEGFMPKAILSDKMFWQKVNYIHYNPVKRGLAANNEDYELSSARDFVFRKPGRILLDEFDYD